MKIRNIASVIFCYLFIVGNTAALAQSTAAILPQGKTQFLDNNGNPLSSGKVFSYIPSTTTFKTTWQDAAETIPNVNPVILDAGGRAIIYGSGSYRQIVQDRNNNTIYDAITASAGTGGTATSIGDGNAVGTIKTWAGLIPPINYVFSYGQEISRTTYSALLASITLSQTFNCTSGNPILTNLSDTSQIPNGAVLESTCIAAGSTVVSKTSTTVTMNNNASLTTSAVGVFFLYGNGNGSSTFNVPDLRGFAIVGRNNMGGTIGPQLTIVGMGGPNPNSTGAKGGSETVTLATTNFPPYTPLGSVSSSYTPAGTISTPTISLSAAATNVVNGGAGGSANLTGGGGALLQATMTATSSTPIFSGTPATISGTFTGTAQGGASTPLRIVQPTQTMNYVIKVLPDINLSTDSVVTSLGNMTGNITCGFGLTCNTQSITLSNFSAASNGVPIYAAGIPTFFNTNGTGNFVRDITPTITTPLINGGTITSAVVTGLASPTSTTDAANKAYVDSFAGGIKVIGPSLLATAAVLPNTPTYSNGASGVGATLTAGSNTTLTVDGTSAPLNTVVLVKNQASALQNGQYFVSTAGSGAAAWVLTRCTAIACGVEFDSAATMLAGSYSLITGGATNIHNAYVLTGTVTTVGTTAANFSLYSSTTGTVSAGAGGIVPTSGTPTTLYNEQMPTGGRLTLVSGTCVATTDQTAKTVIYYAPCGSGQYLPQYDGTNMKLIRFTSTDTDTVGLTLTLGSNWAANTLFDVYFTGTSLCTVSWSSSAVGTSARAIAIAQFKGVNVNGAIATCRDTNTSTVSCAQDQCTLLGTFLTNSSTGTIDLKFGTSTAGGGAACICISNIYNIRNADVAVIDSNTTFTGTFTGAFQQFGGSTGNQINVVQALSAGPPVDVTNEGYGSNSSTGILAMGVGINSATVDSSQTNIGNIAQQANLNLPMRAVYRGSMIVGYNNITRLTYTDNTGGVTTFIGSVAANQLRTSIHGTVPY